MPLKHKTEQDATVSGGRSARRRGSGVLQNGRPFLHFLHEQLKILVAQAAEQAQRQLRPQAAGWVERAGQLPDAYARCFLKTSQHATRAREGGYEAEMKRAAAFVRPGRSTKRSSPGCPLRREALR
jgi:hypothetical protein